VADTLKSGLDLNAEEITDITEKLDSLNSVLENYYNIQELNGKVSSRSALKDVLGIQRSNYEAIFNA
jgi:hypothetical protein